MTNRQALKAVLRARMRPVFKGMSEDAFKMRCLEIMDATVNPASPCGLEIERMEKAFTLTRMIREVRRELEQETQ